MTPFNATKAFAKVAAVLIVSAILCYPYLGCWGFIPVAVILYYTLYFYNRLEERDRRDFDDE
jgi:hypothetical protein